MTNYLITNTQDQRSEEICGALTDNVISKYCILDYIVMNQDSAIMSSFMIYSYMKFDIKIKTLALYNLHLLQAEHGIKSLSTS